MNDRNIHKLPLILEKIERRLLRLLFRFDHWHTSPLAERPYAVDIVKYCNQRVSRQAIIEIGCGLGDIIRNVDFNHKTGLDLDRRVIRAARFVNKYRQSGRLDFFTFEFPKSKLQGTADVIIMVNWPFYFDHDTLRKSIHEYFKYHLKEGGALIIDTLQDSFYPNNHDISILSQGLEASVIRIGAYDRQRELWSIEKVNSDSLQKNVCADSVV